MQNQCEHDWVHMDTIKRNMSAGYNNEWKRIDLFYCKKCLEQRQSEKHSYQREKPDWYQ
jgi:hypothetical protein